MKSSFVDTNIFLHYFTNDDPVKADRIEKLFEEAERQKFVLVSSHLVIAELVWIRFNPYLHL